MLKIRLKRTGKRNAPSYRIVVMDARKPRDSAAKEVLGWFNPSEDPEKITYNKDRLEYWKKNGAQMTKAVENLIKGEYQYEPYTRQNEQEASPPEEAPETEETSEQLTEQTQEQEEEKEAEGGER